jgi:hypothetical protein
MACAPAAGSAPAVGGHDGLVGDLEQVLDVQAAAGRAQLLCSLRFLRRDAGDQGWPLGDEDAFPGLGRDGRGQVVALADRQVAQPAPGIPGLPDVQQPSAGDVDAVDGMVTERWDAWAGID